MISIINEAIDRKLKGTSFTDIVIAEITSLDPIKIRVDERLELTEVFLDIQFSMENYEVGDKVYLIVYASGQRFYVLPDANKLSPGGTIPTMLSQLLEDENHRLVTDIEKENWNNKSDFSGLYEDLSGIPLEFNPTKHKHLWEDITNKPTTFPPSAHNTHWNTIISMPPLFRNAEKLGSIYTSYLDNIEGPNMAGVYYQDSDADTNSSYPIQKAGVLIVTTAGNDITNQEYHVYGTENRKFIRSSYKEKWSPWQEVLTTGITKDYIVDSGKSGNTTWEKWASGTLIQKTKVTTVSGNGTAWGTLFYKYFTENTRNWTFPVPFVGELPAVKCSPKAGFFLMDSLSLTFCNGMAVYRAIQAGFHADNLLIKAVGRWK